MLLDAGLDSFGGPLGFGDGLFGILGGRPHIVELALRRACVDSTGSPSAASEGQPDTQIDHRLSAKPLGVPVGA